MYSLLIESKVTAGENITLIWNWTEKMVISFSAILRNIPEFSYMNYSEPYRTVTHEIKLICEWENIIICIHWLKKHWIVFMQCHAQNKCQICCLKLGIYNYDLRESLQKIFLFLNLWIELAIACDWLTKSVYNLYCPFPTVL